VVCLELFAFLLELGAGVGAVKELRDVIQSTHFSVYEIEYCCWLLLLRYYFGWPHLLEVTIIYCEDQG